jgi:transcriptional regulator with XRE-family HTH domain
LTSVSRSASALTPLYTVLMDQTEINKRLEAGSGYTDLPGRHVSINQIVAYNVAYWRKVAGLTQEELGKLLGWSKAAVSAAERSWDGKRTRQFDADLIMTLAMVLDIPISALFLPPDDDGIDKRYLFHIDQPPLTDCHNMYDLVLMLMSDPSEDDTQVMERYRERYFTTTNFYLGSGRSEEITKYVEDLTTEERIVDTLARAREQYETLRGVLSDIDKMQEALNDRLIELRRARQNPTVKQSDKGAASPPPSS